MIPALQAYCRHACWRQGRAAIWPAFSDVVATYSYQQHFSSLLFLAQHDARSLHVTCCNPIMACPGQSCN